MSLWIRFLSKKQIQGLYDTRIASFPKPGIQDQERASLTYNRWLLPGSGCKDRRVWRTSPISITHCVTCYFSQTLIYQCCPLKPRDSLIVLSSAARPAAICLKLQMNAPHTHLLSPHSTTRCLPWLLITALKNILPVNKQLLIMPGFDLYFVFIHQTSLNGFFHTLQISLKETP